MYVAGSVTGRIVGGRRNDGGAFGCLVRLTILLSADFQTSLLVVLLSYFVAPCGHSYFLFGRVVVDCYLSYYLNGRGRWSKWSREIYHIRRLMN